MSLKAQFLPAAMGILLCTVAHAAPVAPPVRAEIDALLARLETSACEFQRNGKWYKADEARAHLLRKLEYLEDKSLVATTEQFIERGASASSRSGKPYLVRCGSAEPVESGPWLREMLKAARGAGGPASR
jgi:hypothetical protein